MPYYDGNSSPSTVYLTVCRQRYQRSAAFIFNHFDQFRHELGPGRANMSMEFSYHEICSLLDSARNHYSLQSILLGGSTRDAWCAELIAPIIGADSHSGIDRVDACRRIDYLLEDFDRFQNKELIQCQWSILVILASLRVISGV